MSRTTEYYVRIVPLTSFLGPISLMATLARGIWIVRTGRLAIRLAETKFRDAIQVQPNGTWTRRAVTEFNLVAEDARRRKGDWTAVPTSVVPTDWG